VQVLVQVLELELVQVLELEQVQWYLALLGR
jgi:hypothetical protein